ncbi:uncharacterized protein LOC141692197 [Apium graveolens]|uniref:uncharacterized protein LOC141692197 n=1 Tax=Apium graveolens TaxID=4045 RepID=UPI003D78D22B
MVQTDGSNIEQTGGSSAGQISGSRPRGRPRGSKNKEKENSLEMTSTIKSIVLEIPPGTEVLEWMRQFAQSQNYLMNVTSGSGMISQAAISHLSSDQPSVFSENFGLLSFTGTVGKISPSEPAGSCFFSASFARMNGVCDCSYFQEPGCV